MKTNLKCTVAVIAALLAVNPAIAGKKARTSAETIAENTGVEMDSLALRVQVRSLARPFSGVLEGASDRILSAADSPEERIIALRLKINAIPALQGALFISDPLAAVFEVAGLLEQLEIYITEGQGVILPDIVRGEAANAISEMKSRIRDIGTSHGIPAEAGARFWQRAKDWARKHPITNSFVARETTQAIYAQYIKTEKRNLRGLAKRMEESVQDLSLRFDLYAEYIAKQMRWQAELLAEESIVSGLPERLVKSAGPAPVNITELPFDITTEREVILEALRAERQFLLTWAEEQRTDSLEFFSSEREAVGALVGRERNHAIEELQNERQLIFAALDTKSDSVIDDLKGLIETTIHDAGLGLIDHAALRMLQLLAAIWVASILGGCLLIFFARRIFAK